MKANAFDQYDGDKLQKAKKLLMEVYEHNYGVPRMGDKIKRLETIISKLEILQNFD